MRQRKKLKTLGEKKQWKKRERRCEGIFEETEKWEELPLQDDTFVLDGVEHNNMDIQ